MTFCWFSFEKRRFLRASTSGRPLLLVMPVFWTMYEAAYPSIRYMSTLLDENIEPHSSVSLGNF